MVKETNKDLDVLVDDLEKKSDKKEIVSCLRDIMKTFLKNYIIVLSCNNGDSITIRPLWVEAYYYKDGVFNDKYTHGADENNKYAEDMQTNRFGELYVHKNDWGIDVCLSKGEDYCFSLLIKCALIDDEFCSQSIIYERIKKLCQQKNCGKRVNGVYKKDCIFYDKIIIMKHPSNEANDVMFTVRVGLKGEKEEEGKEFKDSLLAAFIYDKDVLSNYRWATGFAKQWTLVVNYLIKNNIDLNKNDRVINDVKIEGTYYNQAKTYYDEEY